MSGLGRTAAALVVVLASLTACAQIPTSGPVEQRGEVRSERDDPFVRVLAKGPVAGMGQQEVLEGFLRASASFDDDHSVAREFLAPEAAATWDPSQGAVVYSDDPDRTILEQDGNVLQLSARKVAAISARGEFEAATTDSMTKASFSMRKVEGEWRIADLPDGLFLTPLDVDRSYRSFDLYFLDGTSTRLVPNAVFVPVGPVASTSLVTALLEGPTDWLAPAVRTAFPAGTQLTVPSAPVQDGVVQVDLSSSVLGSDLEDRQALAAQLVWTLRQLPDVSAVRITSGGLPLPGLDPQQARDAWPQFSPDGPPVGEPYLERDGRVLVQVAGKPVPLPGKLGDGSIPATDPASSPEGDLLAALSPAGDRLFLTTPSVDAPVRTRLVAPRLTAPSWDPFGSVWTTSRTGGVTTVWAVRPGDDPPQRVASPELADQPVVALRIARDGVRVAVVVGDDAGGRSLLVGRIERGETPRLGGLRRVESTLVDVIDVAWADADRMAVLGQEPNGVVQPLIVEADGTVRRAAGSLSGLVRIAAAPGKPLIAATSDGTIWLDTDVGWQNLGKGSAPAYPG